jgi:hypothetical protein
MGFLLMMTVILEGAFLGNGIAFSGAVWYNLGAEASSWLAP